MSNDSVLKNYFPDDAHKVQGEEPFVDTNEELLSQEYGGDLKHVNTPPQEIRRKLQSEKDPEQIRLLKIGLRYWDSKKSDIECGEPYRGDKAPDRKIKKLSDLIGENGRATHIESLGSL